MCYKNKKEREKGKIEEIQGVKLRESLYQIFRVPGG